MSNQSDEFIIAQRDMQPLITSENPSLANGLVAHCKTLAPLEISTVVSSSSICKRDTQHKAFLTGLAETDDIYKPGLVHRIDKDTSGVILAAKTEKVHAHISKQFQKRTVNKEY